MIVNTFMPKYMKNFKCIGSKCTDTCCAGWDINIDEDSLAKYKNSTGELKDIVEGKFISNNKEDDFFNAGYMILKDESRCPFLNEKMLCDIHGNIGEENLCITCKNYPRVFNIIDDVYEKSALTSCEEVCSLFLDKKSKLEFIESEEAIDENSIEIRRIIDTEAFQGTESLLQYFWEIRLASINIMQDRKYTIEERLSILKKFYTIINDFREDDDFNSIEDLLDAFNENSFNYNDLMDSCIEVDNIFKEMIADDKLIDNIRSKRLKRYALQYKELLKKDISIKEYKIIDNDLNTYSYIFENYIVNQIFKDVIPFNKGENILDSINALINTYKLIKEYIKGNVIGENSHIYPKDIVGVIQAVSKDIEHNKVFSDIINYKF